MMITLTLQVLEVFILAGIGFLMFKTGKITLEGNKTLGNIPTYLSACSHHPWLYNWPFFRDNKGVPNIGGLWGRACPLRNLVFTACLVRCTDREVRVKSESVCTIAAAFPALSLRHVPLVARYLCELVFHLQELHVSPIRSSFSSASSCTRSPR